MSILESTRKMTTNEKMCYDMGYAQGKKDAVPVVRGEWVENPTKDSVLCSYCHADWNLFDNDTYRFCYCPNCGCDMRGERDGEK